MIEMRRAQLSFGDGLIAEEVSDLREDWMKPMRCWRMKRLSRLCARHWGSGVPRAAAAAVGAYQPTWCCDC